MKVKLVLEDKLKIWSFESENINELTLPSVLEDVESLFNDQLRKRRLHAKLLYTDKDFGCEVEVETNLDLRSVLNDCCRVPKTPIFTQLPYSSKPFLHQLQLHRQTKKSVLYRH